MNRFAIALSASFLLGLANHAAAEGFISPFVGTTLTSASGSGDHSKAGVGLAFGKMGRVMVSEAEIAYFPEVLDSAANALEKNQVLMFSGDFLVGPTIGRIKPYGALGAGDLHLNVTSLSSLVTPSPDGLSSDYLAINAGAGAMGFFNTHLGVRGDLRYYRAFGFDALDLENGGLALKHFNFWRAGIGLVAKF